MPSRAEVMAIERTFEAAVVKAMRSLEQKPPDGDDLRRRDLIDQPNDRRLFALLAALRGGARPETLADRSGIDRWFIDRLAHIVHLEEEGDVRSLRRAGFADTQIAALRGEPVAAGHPTYKRGHTCAAESAAPT